MPRAGQFDRAKGARLRGKGPLGSVDPKNTDNVDLRPLGPLGLRWEDIDLAEPMGWTRDGNPGGARPR